MYFFIEQGWCKKGSGYLDSYERLAATFHKVKDHKEDIVREFITNDLELKRFLIAHSVFNASVNVEKDWLEKLMIQLLSPTEEDIIWFTTLPEVPKEILDKLKILNPEPIRWWRDPVRVEYKMYGSPSRGESYEPIHVIDEDWEKIINEQISIPDRIKQYDVIEL